MKVLVTMGFFDASGECRLVEADLDRGTTETRLSFVPPEPLRMPEKGFTGAAWSGSPGASTLLVCGSHAVFHLDPSGFDVIDIWHQPCMNDLHHVALTDDRVYVVNTGLESIDVFTRDGLFLGSHALHPAWLSAQRQAGVSPTREDWPLLRDAHWPPEQTEMIHNEPAGAYYTSRAASAQLPFSKRKLRDYVHPNHITLHGTQMLVTRFLDCAVDDITTFRRVIEDTPGLPHDGIIHDNQFWLTCVNGLVLAYAIENGVVTGREIEQFDVFDTGFTGWCRGLYVTDDFLVVGLTEIRRMPRHRWCDRPVETTETSLLVFRRSTRKLEQRILLRDGSRQTKIFSVLPI